MNELCALDIQNKLKKLEAISIPLIQSKLGMSYKDARMFLDLMIERGWIGENPQGIYYKINKENLCLRNIKRREIKGLIKDVNNDLVLVLKDIQENNPEGVTFEAVKNSLRFVRDVEEAFELLTDHKLINRVGEKYFCCVSQKTINVLLAVARTKRMLERKNMQDYDDDDDDDNDGIVYEDEIELIELFDELF